MGFSCNIDRAGRNLRGISGVIFLAMGILFLIRCWPPNWKQWVIGVILLAIGGFQIFEAAIGWCAVRAMGFKTRV
jgi:hypothetical protein